VRTGGGDAFQKIERASQSGILDDPIFGSRSIGARRRIRRRHGVRMFFLFDFFAVAPPNFSAVQAAAETICE
jgi:hypothetical protein